MICLEARTAAAALTDLRASRAEIQLVSTLLDRWNLIKEHMSAALVSGNPPTDGAGARVGGGDRPTSDRTRSCAWRPARGQRRGREAKPLRPRERFASLYRRMLASALRDPIDLGALAVDGDDLRRAGIPPGPSLGRILQALLASVIVDPARNTPDWLLQEAQRLERDGQVTSPPNAGHTDRR